MVKILLVENDVSFRKMLKVALHLQFPLTVIEEAVDGNEALRKIDDFLPALILMDVQLPDGSGLLFTQKIKEDHPEIIIGILTNYGSPEYREAAIKYGANRIFAKSSWEEVATLVKSISSDLDSRTSNRF